MLNGAASVYEDTTVWEPDSYRRRRIEPINRGQGCCGMLPGGMFGAWEHYKTDHLIFKSSTSVQQDTSGTPRNEISAMLHFLFVKPPCRAAAFSKLCAAHDIRLRCANYFILYKAGVKLPAVFYCFVFNHASLCSESWN